MSKLPPPLAKRAAAEVAQRAVAELAALFESRAGQIAALIVEPLLLGLAASAALCDYFAPILAARRAEPKDDLISALAQAEDAVRLMRSAA